MQIGVLGKGFVGSAVYEGLQWAGNQLCSYDPKIESSKFEDILNTECVFICVPTNPMPDGTCDTSIVEECLKKLFDANYHGIMVIKSTVTPGTTQRLIDMYSERSPEYSTPGTDYYDFSHRIVFCPEFLRERSAVTDFIDNHDILITGSASKGAALVVREAHHHLPKSFAWMSPTEAELCKYFNNVFNAARIVFANGFYEVAKALGADYQKIFSAMIQRNCITSHYLACNESLRGYSGKCLVKDTLAFARLIEHLKTENKLKVYPEIFKMINNDNNKYDRTIIGGSCSEDECFGKELRVDL